MKDSKAVTIDGHLVKIDSDGMLFRLNGNGLWQQITNVELFNLVNNEELSDKSEIEYESNCEHQQNIDLGIHDDYLDRSQ